MVLSKVKTSELVAELETREGVKMVIADPYQKGEVSVEGPVVILVVMDWSTTHHLKVMGL